MRKIIDLAKGFVNILKNGEAKNRAAAWAVIALLVILPFAASSYVTDSAYKPVPSSVFVDQLNKGNISKLTINSKEGSVRGEFKEPVEGNAKFNSNTPESSEAFVSTYLKAPSNNIEYDFTKTPAIVSLVGSLVAVLFNVAAMGFLLLYLFRKMGEGGIASLMSKEDTAKVVEKTPSTRFSDIAGIPETVAELKEIVSFLKDPEVYQSAGAKIPHGVLLTGAPGTGKTMCAKALAGEAGVPFITIPGSGFVELYVGVGASRARELFKKAREKSPCIVFIDEIDAIGGKRSSSPGKNDEREQTLNQILTEMDGFDETTNILVVAATNRSDMLDPALLRPGRFDRVIGVDAPSAEGREAILKHYAQGHPFFEPVDFSKLAKQTSGLTGAELQNMVNEAACMAARRAQALGESVPKITAHDLDEGFSRTIAGPEIVSKPLTKDEKRITSYHEAGHAIVQYFLPECAKVQKISIVSRNFRGTGRALGYVQTFDEQDKYLMTSTAAEQEIAALLAGRCAELLYCGVETAGASNDLEKANELAYRMVDRFAFSQLGCSEKLASQPGSLRVGMTDKNGFDRSADSRKAFVDREVESILENGYQVAHRLLVEHRDKADAIVEILLEREIIRAEEVDGIMGSEPKKGTK